MKSTAILSASDGGEIAMQHQQSIAAKLHFIIMCFVFDDGSIGFLSVFWFFKEKKK
jgi:hypothetical protein